MSTTENLHHHPPPFAAPRGAGRLVAVLLAFGLGYWVAAAPAPDFSDRHLRAAGPQLQDWHGNVMGSGGN